jgi:hypothetical protein
MVSKKIQTIAGNGHCPDSLSEEDIMLGKRILSVFVLVTVFCMYTTSDLQAAAIQTPTTSHAVSSQELHQAVQISNQQTNVNRASVQDFLARPEVKKQIQSMGIKPETLTARVATLSPSDLQHLNNQIMAAGLQKETSGLGKGAIIAIVAGGVALIVLCVVIIVVAADDATTTHSSIWY